MTADFLLTVKTTTCIFTDGGRHETRICLFSFIFFLFSFYLPLLILKRRGWRGTYIVLYTEGTCRYCFREDGSHATHTEWYIVWEDSVQINIFRALVCGKEAGKDQRPWTTDFTDSD